MPGKKITKDLGKPQKKKKKRFLSRMKSQNQDESGLETKGVKEDSEDDEVEQVVVSGSIATTSREFNPSLFLAREHSNTTFPALEKGLNTLGESVQKSNDRMSDLVKQHYNAFVFCQLTADSLLDLVGEEIGREEQGRIATLETTLKRSQEVSPKHPK